MLRRVMNSSSAATSVQRRLYVQLQSETYCERLSDKIVRGAPAENYYAHPCWVMSREKMLNTIWVDQGIFKQSVNLLVPFFAVALFFKA